MLDRAVHTEQWRWAPGQAGRSRLAVPWLPWRPRWRAGAEGERKEEGGGEMEGKVLKGEEVKGEGEVEGKEQRGDGEGKN